VIGFDDEHQAFEMRATLAKFQKEYLIEMLEQSWGRNRRRIQLGG
jgi:uncharacterized membrane protein